MRPASVVNALAPKAEAVTQSCRNAYMSQNSYSVIAPPPPVKLALANLIGTTYWGQLSNMNLYIKRRPTCRVRQRGGGLQFHGYGFCNDKEWGHAFFLHHNFLGDAFFSEK